jgi:hypothetical protein
MYCIPERLAKVNAKNPDGSTVTVMQIPGVPFGFWQDLPVLLIFSMSPLYPELGNRLHD